MNWYKIAQKNTLRDVPNAERIADLIISMIDNNATMNDNMVKSGYLTSIRIINPYTNEIILIPIYLLHMERSDQTVGEPLANVGQFEDEDYYFIGLNISFVIDSLNSGNIDKLKKAIIHEINHMIDPSIDVKRTKDYRNKKINYLKEWTEINVRLKEFSNDIKSVFHSFDIQDKKKCLDYLLYILKINNFSLLSVKIGSTIDLQEAIGLYQKDPKIMDRLRKVVINLIMEFNKIIKNEKEKDIITYELV